MGNFSGKRLTVNVFAIFLDRNFAQLIRSLVILFILAPYLGPAKLGLYNAAVVYTMFVGVLVDFGLNQALARELPRRRKDERGVILGSAILFKALLAVGGALNLIMP